MLYKHFNIATNQSLNQKVPMFLHRGFVFAPIPKGDLNQNSLFFAHLIKKNISPIELNTYISLFNKNLFIDHLV